MADADRGKTRCPYATPKIYKDAGKVVWQCCEEGMWVTYDVNTINEIRREPHQYCKGTGMIRH